MNRKQFIQEQGATCRNWTWSWSFINHEKKMVIFGAWDVESEQDRAVILRESWVSGSKSKKQSGYTQAIEHIRYLNEGYDLYTFNMVFSEHPDNPEIAVIKDFERKLDKRYLKKEGDTWYAEFFPNPYPDEIPSPESFTEGAKKQITVNAYERDPKARKECIAHHGAVCKCCGFDFERVYGEHGKGFIHVHHIKALHTVGEDYNVDPHTDLVPLCPNCHAMIHHGKKDLKVEGLRAVMIRQKNNK